MDSFEQLARLVQRLTRASGESPFIDFSATQASADVSHDDALGLFGSESPVSWQHLPSQQPHASIADVLRGNAELEQLYYLRRVCQIVVSM